MADLIDGVNMAPRYTYKFVRLATKYGWMFETAPAQTALDSYQDVVHEHALKGWRLIQIFAPSIKLSGRTSYLELIFERPVTSSNDDPYDRD